MPEDSAPTFEERFTAHMQLTVDFAKAAERIVKAKRDIRLVIRDVEDLLDLDAGSMMPEVRAALPHFEELDGLLDRTFGFMCARLDTHRELMFPTTEGGDNDDGQAGR